jgi:hypothetical protein
VNGEIAGLDKLIGKLIGKLIVDIHIVDWPWAQRPPTELTIKPWKRTSDFSRLRKRWKKGAGVLGREYLHSDSPYFKVLKYIRTAVGNAI